MRAIGRSLDRQAASRITLLEVTDGFLVRTERFRHTHVDVAVSHVARESLQLERSIPTGESSRRTARRTALWSDFSHTYEDFFRALGFELDDSEAADVLLDETDSGLFLSYRRRATGWTRQVILAKNDIEQILNEAVRRRRTEGSGGKPVPTGAPERAVGHETGERRETIWTPEREEIPYQDVLRAAGAMLDELGARRVCLVEAPTGFAVRYELPGESNIHWRWLTVEELQESRESLRRRQAKFRPSSGTTPGGYEDIFRALGYQLEGERASGLLIDCETKDLIVTYNFLDPGRSFNRMKRYLALSRNEQDQLLEEARGRRQTRPDFLSRLRARRGRRTE